jgi:putative ATP-binding cassette transporter
LRDGLLRTEQRVAADDARINATLHDLGLDAALARAGGLDQEQNWSELLSLNEQQLLAFSRVVLATPEFAFLDHPSRALNPEQVGDLLRKLRGHMITYLTLGDAEEDEAAYDLVVDIAGDGTWTARRGDAAGPDQGPQMNLGNPLP